MENKPCDLNIPEEVEHFALSLFRRLCESIRKEYLIFEKTIPYSFVWSFFSFYKIGRTDAKKIIKLWIEKKLCEYVKFSGIRINEKIANEILKSMVNNAASEKVEKNGSE
ncbi:MAG: hypothetical protein QXW01_00270 [Candidatus Aenigmatarchaeota archaeon]